MVTIKGGGELLLYWSLKTLESNKSEPSKVSLLPSWCAAAPAFEPIDHPYDIHRRGIEGLLQVGARQADIATPTQIKRRTPCDSVLSTPARSAYCVLNSAVSCRCRAACMATCCS